ncbi:MAG: hypothetical protein KZQ93_20160 [Candidatus Thiodiazotropha sp. (ex Monitilora ramsayi)]|nr:hypothetical protein [Candidatus Thiodiazotropha sp. (ex Monitilora ramsayi)]
MTKSFVIILTTTLVLIGCAKQPEEEVGYGVLENGHYTNSYFNMSVQVPKTWFVQSKAAQKELTEAGTSLLAGKNDNLKAILEESDKQSVTLLSLFKYEQGAPVPFNPSIIAVAERVKHLPGVKRGSDYLYHVKQHLNSGQLNYQFPADIYNVNISALSFDVMPAQIDTGFTMVRQEYYAARVKDYVISVILSYSDDTDVAELKEIVDNFRFNE